MKFMEGDRSLISDQMPVDVVADTIIVAAAVYANQNKLSVILEYIPYINHFTDCALNKFFKTSHYRR